jgi:hypothetical protein
MDRDEKTDDWVVDEATMNALGEKPTEIKVMLPYDSVELNLPHEYSWWKSSKRMCQGNGEYALRSQDDGSDPVEMACPCDLLGEQCKPAGILNCIVIKSQRIGGVHQFRTSSHNSIENLKSSLGFIKSVGGGPLVGIPLWLTLQPQKVTPKKGGGQITIYVAGLEFRGDPQLETSAIEQLQAVASVQIQARLATGQDMRQLEAGAARINENLDEDAYDQEHEFRQSEEVDRVGVVTDSKTVALKERLKQTDAKPKPQSKPAEPTDAEIKENLRTEIDTMLDEVAKHISKPNFKKWTTWMDADPAIEKLIEGKAKIAEQIEAGEIAAKTTVTVTESKNTGAPTKADLTAQLTDLMAIGFEDGVATQDECDKVAADIAKKQTNAWLTGQIAEWETSLDDRREIRKSEGAEGPADDKQESLLP